MSIQEGDKIPAATLHSMQDGKPTPMTTEEIFAGKKVVLFAVPGAFTPTCSMAHLPGYVVNADSIKGKGVDTIACVSVNDAFVMDAWGQNKNAEELLMLGDGNGDLTEALGRVLDDYSLVKYFPLDITNEENIADLTLMIDQILQVSEDADVKVVDQGDEDPEEPYTDD